MSLDPDLQQQCNDLGITFWKEPVAPVRVPRRGRDGRLLLDFASEPARQQFKEKCIHKVSSNCVDGARAGCSLRAIDHCRGSSWLRWLGWKSKKPWAEMEACEEQYMEACLVRASEACKEHAERFCEVVVAKRPGRDNEAKQHGGN